jgi:23S rRNA-/tRNA-specific pseudouridylate synthase
MQLMILRSPLPRLFKVKSVSQHYFRKGGSQFTTNTTKMPSTIDDVTNNQDIYRVDIQDSHMNVFMSSPLHEVVSSNKKKVDKRLLGNNSTLSTEALSTKEGAYVIPESARQYERQLRKIQAATRASTPIEASQLCIIHNDPQIVVVNKPSGVLTVPGVNNNPNMLSLLYETLGTEECQVDKMEHMIVHRLDMDTSGVVIFAKTREAMSKLQATFRRDVKTAGHVEKSYEALLCGHLNDVVKTGKIDLPLQRDHRNPPFMRVATPTSEREAKEVVKGLNHAGWKKIVKKNAKQSQTLLEVMNKEFVSLSTSIEDRDTAETYPVTRVKLTPITGRTHQLRVHCAAIGHPILADPTYGILGEASQNGGFEDSSVDSIIPTRASIELQMKLDKWTKDTQQVMCLHARKLQLDHPVTGEKMCFEELPEF